MPKIRDQKSLWIRQSGGHVQGPFPASRIRSWADQGKVRPSMEFSINGKDWMPGSAVPGLFEAVIDLVDPQEDPSRAKSTPWGICVVSVFGLIGAFMPFVIFRSELFSRLGTVSTIWENIYGCLAAPLFGVLLVLAAYHWRTWNPKAERIVGRTAIVVGILQIAAFVGAAAVLQKGWTGTTKTLFEAHEARDELPKFRESLQSMTRGASTPETKKRWESIRKITKFTDQMTARPAFDIGLYWLALCGVLAVAFGIELVRWR